MVRGNRLGLVLDSNDGSKDGCKDVGVYVNSLVGSIDGCNDVGV